MLHFISQIILVMYVIGLVIGLIVTCAYWVSRPKPHVHDPADPLSVPLLLAFSVLWFIPCTYFIKKQLVKPPSTS